MSLPDPVIVIPGVTANYLLDMYPLPPADIWTVLKLGFEQASLHPDDPRYEAMLPSLVRPGQLYEVAYKELIEELRHNLSAQPDQPVPVYPFPYDWRQPLEAIEIQLKAFVEEVVARTSLLPHYARDGYAKRGTVALVGHSMGGLVIAGYLERFKKQSAVTKVCTLAAPFGGSFEAIIKVTTGTANLGVAAPTSREREAARLTPSLYYLMPRYGDKPLVDPNIAKSFFDPAAWQASVVQSIETYVKLRGINQANPGAQAQAIFKKLLVAAESFRNRIDGFALNQAGLKANDWLCVVGVGSTTRVRVKVVAGPDFRFDSSDRDDRWKNTNPNERKQTGDGTVPFLGAVPRFLGEENIVCVTPDDFGYWEVQDQVTTQIAGFHGIMPNMDMLHRLMVRHFTGAGDPHGNTWGRRAPGVAVWQPPVQPLTEK